jgi:glucose uptake protein
MFVLKSYGLAVVFCIITMLCWGSWANTKKLTSDAWRYQLYYWDYAFGILVMAVIFAFTLGSLGRSGRRFLDDLKQAKTGNVISALVGGVIFNPANILLVAAIDVSGMSVAFPIGIGLALVIGVLVNYWAAPKGNPYLLFSGVALVTAAIILTALANSTIPGQSSGDVARGIILAVLCGLLMGYFYRFVAKAMAPDFEKMEPGKLSPYTAMVLFSIGIVLSNFVFNTAVMIRPFKGDPVPFSSYFDGTLLQHFWGLLGGVIWAVGMMFSIIAFGKAGPAISYGLGQGATLVAAFCGVFIWHEFKKAPSSTNALLAVMFLGYFLGLALIILAGRTKKERIRG